MASSLDGSAAVWGPVVVAAVILVEFGKVLSGPPRGLRFAECGWSSMLLPSRLWCWLSCAAWHGQHVMLHAFFNTSSWGCDHGPWRQPLIWQPSMLASQYNLLENSFLKPTAPTCTL